MKNEIKHGLELEKEITEKKTNLIKTLKDTEKVTDDNERENEQSQKLKIQMDRMKNNSEGMPQV